MPRLNRLIITVIEVGIVVFLTQATHAQELLKFDKNDSLFGGYFGLEVTLNRQSIYTYESTDEARAVVARITKTVGLRPNFIVLAAAIPNAAAVVHGEDRIILYSNVFMESLTTDGEPNWAALSVLAHEIGHHLQGHTIRTGPSRPKIELEADYFSGFAVGHLGGSLAQASAAINQISSPDGSKIYPRKAERLEAIAAGWKKAKSTQGNKHLAQGNPKKQKINFTKIYHKIRKLQENLDGNTPQSQWKTIISTEIGRNEPFMHSDILTLSTNAKDKENCLSYAYDKADKLFRYAVKDPPNFCTYSEPEETRLCLVELITELDNSFLKYCTPR